MLLKDKSVLKIKTDWDDYAQEIENDLNQIFSNTKKHINKKTDLFTKYEKTAIEEKRNIIYLEAYWARSTFFELITICGLTPFFF